MTDLSRIDISLECDELDSVSGHGRKLIVDIDSADMVNFIDDYQEDILEHLGEGEVGKWLESQGYRVEAE